MVFSWIIFIGIAIVSFIVQSSLKRVSLKSILKSGYPME